jgi:hypothetical protein
MPLNRRAVPVGRGDYRGNLLNVLTGLRRDPLLAHLFAYDELYCGAMLLAPVPGQPKDDAPYPRPVTDFHVQIVIGPRLEFFDPISPLSQRSNCSAHSPSTPVLALKASGGLFWKYVGYLGYTRPQRV